MESTEILSNITVFNKYSKYLQDKERRETWKEIAIRNRDMHIKKYPNLKDEIVKVYKDFVIPKKVLMSMRSAQFAGKPIELTPSRMYNCCFAPVDHYKVFSEVMFLLLGGTGVGYSVQSQHVDKLPEIRKPVKTRKYVIADSIEGWADAVKMLCKSYFEGKPKPRFIFDDIRPKGAKLITSGGKAPGPEPLKDCLHNLEKIFERKENGDKITTLEAHDMMCYIADAVLAGGIRRAALICLFDIDDNDMLTCKFGNWWELNPQRGRANNSAVILRHRITKSRFLEVWGKIKASGSGEPGIYLSNNPNWGTNPCCEIALRPYQFCNLTEINMSDIKTQEELNSRARAAAFLGTLQAGYTDFHYLRDIWKKTTEKDALIGVSGTGIASGAYKKLNLSQATEEVKKENERVSTILGINKAARTTCVKPAGTTSLVLGTSSGIHAWFAPYYIRRLRLGKDEALYKYVKRRLPDLIEDEYFNPNKQAVLSIPVKAPTGGIFRDESAIDMLERVKKFSLEWVKPGHIKGENTHNVSATVFLKDDEWKAVGEWMWKNRECYNGLSVLPYDGGTYKQAPFEEISKTTYYKLEKLLKNIDLTKVKEVEDETDLKGEIACAGGVCEIV
jgi:ribonucleoside-diphosphate reductase alpha chain